VFALTFQYLGGNETIEQHIKSASVSLSFLMTRPTVPGATLIEEQG